VTQSVGSAAWSVRQEYVVGSQPQARATVVHNSGGLYVTNAATNASFVIGQGGAGAYVLAGGTVVADRLFATNWTYRPQVRST
jgi:hypothetical protein